jgi:polyhydroxyalkanoate synthesis regulator phasin
MKAVLEIKDSKALFMMELLKSFSFVKVQPITNEKALLLSEIKEAVDTVNLIKKGKIQARPAKALIDEISCVYHSSF